MRKWFLTGICIVLVILGFYNWNNQSDKLVNDTNEKNSSSDQDEYVTAGTETYRGFILDNVFHSKDNGDIHYNVYIPDSYDGSEAYALYFTLPGYQGLYFQGVGENIKTEEFGFVAQDYHEKMIVVAPQLNDWAETSANQTIALVEYFIAHYNIDESMIYADGYSGGGETMSLVIAKRADLFTAYLHASTKWDGDYKAVVDNRTPVYIAIGKDDEYYGFQPSQETYDELYRLYKEEGLSDDEIDELLVLDIKDENYFTSQGVDNQHGGGAMLFARDEQIMSWLFNKKK